MRHPANRGVAEWRLPRFAALRWAATHSSHFIGGAFTGASRFVGARENDLALRENCAVKAFEGPVQFFIARNTGTARLTVGRLSSLLVGTAAWNFVALFPIAFFTSCRIAVCITILTALAPGPLEDVLGARHATARFRIETRLTGG